MLADMNEMTATVTTSVPAAHTSIAPVPRHVAVIGATRGIGRSFVEQALAVGHRVTVLARNPERFELRDARLSVVAGSATDLDAVRAVVRGTDAVVCALGAPALRRTRIRSEGTRRILEAMEAEGVGRLLCVSVMGVGDTREALPFFLRRIIFPTYLRGPVADHEAQERLIEASGVDWTIARPPTLTDGPRTGMFARRFGTDLGGLSLKISRADVAGFLLEQLDADEYRRRAVGISYEA